MGGPIHLMAKFRIIILGGFKHQDLDFKPKAFFTVLGPQKIDRPQVSTGQIVNLAEKQIRPDPFAGEATENRPGFIVGGFPMFTFQGGLEVGVVNADGFNGGL